jgi:hypothetical protein
MRGDGSIAACALIVLGAVSSANALPSGAPGGLRAEIDEQTITETVPCRWSPWGWHCYRVEGGPVYLGPLINHGGYGPSYAYPQPPSYGPRFYHGQRFYRRWWW